MDLRVRLVVVVEAFFLFDRVATGFALVDLVVERVVLERLAGFATEDFFFVERAGFAFFVVAVEAVPVDFAALAFLVVALVDRVDFLVEGFAVFFVDDRLAGAFLAGFFVVFLVVAIPMAPR